MGASPVPDFCFATGVRSFVEGRTHEIPVRDHRVCTQLWIAQGTAQTRACRPQYRAAHRGSARETEERPALPYKVVSSWPTLPKRVQSRRGLGSDVDRQGNVWVFNRGHWPVMQFDRGGKLLQSWTEDTVKLRSAHGFAWVPTAPSGASTWMGTSCSSSVPRAGSPGVGEPPRHSGQQRGRRCLQPAHNVAFRANGILRFRWLREFPGDRVQPARRVRPQVGNEGHGRWPVQPRS